MSSTYKPHIDGLRALAVIPVLLFHANVPGFSGGFVGVDIFFVISGYLITGILLADLRDGKFSIANFYERRVRRIIPALLFCCFGTLLIGAAILLPFQLEDLSYSAAATLAFGSNIWFWRTIDYFADAQLPLLHTWSLGVEEQFYLLFPPALYLLYRFGKVRLGIAVVLVLSLLLSAYLVTRMPAATFYLLPTRAWELMAGALLAVTGWQVRREFAWLGLALTAASIVLITESTVFPGMAAIPPVLGAALLISADGLPFLRHRAVVWVGLISYSLYLWHWPLLVYFRHLGWTSPLQIFACLALAFVIAAFSWAYVERPFRDRKRMGRPRLVKAALAGTAVVAATTACTATGLDWRLSKQARAYASGHADRPWTVECLTRPCTIGPGAPQIILWGDSHGAAVGEAVALVANRRGQAAVIEVFNACPPLVPALTSKLEGNDIRNCSERNQRILGDFSPGKGAQTVILAAYWEEYLRNDSGALLASLSQTIGALRRAGKRVIVIAGLPTALASLPELLALQSYFGRPVPRTFPSRPLDPRLIAAAHGAEVIDLRAHICGPTACPTTVGGRPIFFDAHHLSRIANRTLVATVLEKSL